MKTKTINGARTPEVIRAELKKVGKLEAIVTPKGSSIYYEYFTTNQFGEDTPAMEITLTQDGKAIAARKIDKEALRYLIPNYKTESKTNDNFIFGGF